MLATTCEVCGTVELQDKHGKIYCVACEEIDCEENSKDNPAVNPRAARNQIAEGQLEDLESQSITDRNQVHTLLYLHTYSRVPNKTDENEIFPYYLLHFFFASNKQKIPLTFSFFHLKVS